MDYRPARNRLTLSLALTEECNLRCSYCYQGERRRGAMPFDLATSAISRYLNGENAFDEVMIELIGGEVLLYWDLVKSIISWTLERQGSWRRPLHFSIDTNATLLTDDIKDWLSRRRKCVTACLSLDGTPEAHDANRCGSYSRIEPHLRFFAETWPQQPVKMTIGPRAVPMTFDGILHAMSFGFKVSANVPMEDIWGPPSEKAKCVSAFRNEIFKLVQYFAEHPELELPSIINLPIHRVTMEPTEDSPWCGSGRCMTAVDMDGTEVPCHRYLRMSFDRALFSKPIPAVQSNCSLCLFKPACPTCEANNWVLTGNPNVRTSYHCEFVKLQIWGTAQVQLQRLEKRVSELRSQDRLESDSDRKEIRAIAGQLRVIRDILAEFERHDDISRAGILEPGRLCSLPPTEPRWTLPWLSGIRYQCAG